MDRRTITGLVIIAAMVIFWSVFLSPNKEDEKAKEKATADKAKNAPADTNKAPNQGLVADTTLTDSASKAKLAAIGEQTYGAFLPLTQGEAKTLTVETDKYNITLSTKGGTIKTIILKDYKTYDGKPLPIQSADTNNILNLEFTHDRRMVETRYFYFNTTQSGPLKVTGKDTKELRLRAELSPKQYIEHVYTFYGDSFHVDYKVRFVGMAPLINDNIVRLFARSNVPKTEKSADKMRPMVNILYNYQDDIEKLNPASNDPEEKKEDGKITWVGFKSQFFSQAFLAKGQPFSAIKLKKTVAPEDTTSYVKTLEATIDIPYKPAATDSFVVRMFAGPNDLFIMNDYGVQLEKQIDLGWGPMGAINRYAIYPLFKFLEDFLGNYGLIIFLMAVIIKIIILPLTYRSYLSTAKMQIVNKMPEVKELEEKHKGNATKLQQEKMVFYRQAGVSPLGGCIPLLLQLPILIAMFSFFPSLFELRQQGFLWADDLSTYDSIWDFGKLPIINTIYGDHVSLFTVLMTISQLVYTWIQQKTQTQPSQFAWMGYVLPVIFLGILNNYAAGLSYYYFLTNILTIAQTYIIRAFVDEKKLMDKLQATRIAKASKPGANKPSRMQQWLEDQQKKQLAKQQQQKGNQKPKGK